MRYKYEAIVEGYAFGMSDIDVLDKSIKDMPFNIFECDISKIDNQSLFFKIDCLLIAETIGRARMFLSSEFYKIPTIKTVKLLLLKKLSNEQLEYIRRFY